MSVWQALIIALWVALVQSRFFGFASLNLRFSPLMTSLVAGLVLGDVATGVATGAVIQLITMGQIAPGGQMPSEPSVSAGIAVPISILGGLNPTAAIAIAVPVGLLGSYLYNFKIFLNSFTNRYIDYVVNNLKTNQFTAAYVFLPTLINLVLYVPVMFIALYYGAPVIGSFVQGLEGTVVVHVLEVIGGGLPAFGIAMLLTIIGRKKYLWFFVVAFFASTLLAPLGFSTLAWTILGVAASALYVQASQAKTKS